MVFAGCVGFALEADCDDVGSACDAGLVAGFAGMALSASLSTVPDAMANNRGSLAKGVMTKYSAV